MVKTNFPYCFFFSFLLIFKKKNGFIHTILKPFFMNVDKDELCSSFQFPVHSLSSSASLISLPYI